MLEYMLANPVYANTINNNSNFQFQLPHFYSKSVLHRESQIQQVGGSNSCTYICLEMAQYFLNGLIHHDSADLLYLIKQVLVEGVKQDLQIGNTSCEQILPKIKRFNELYLIPHTVMAKLKNSTVFSQLLENMAKRNAETAQRQCVIFTKPPETIAIFHDKDATPYPFIIFDSHPRSFELDKGAGSYFFKDAAACEAHLKTLYQLTGPQPAKDAPEYLMWAQNNMFDASSIILKSVHHKMLLEQQAAQAKLQKEQQQKEQQQQQQQPTVAIPQQATSAAPAPITPVMLENLRIAETIEKMKEQMKKEQEAQLAELRAALKKEQEEKQQYATQVQSLVDEMEKTKIAMDKVTRENSELQQVVAKQRKFIEQIQQITSTYQQ